MVMATVHEWHEEEGWGVLDSPETPGGCWGHFSNIRMDGYRTLSPGQKWTSSGRPPAPSRTHIRTERCTSHRGPPDTRQVKRHTDAARAYVSHPPKQGDPAAYPWEKAIAGVRGQVGA